ncbi:unnamed protein product [Urochloa humidicola]
MRAQPKARAVLDDGDSMRSAVLVGFCCALTPNPPRDGIATVSADFFIGLWCPFPTITDACSANQRIAGV